MRTTTIRFCLNLAATASLILGTALDAYGGAQNEFEIFDGRTYNGKFYPRIDIIEWGSPSHMEFHIYQKNQPIDLAFELEKKDSKTVMLVQYNLSYRSEKLCRRVLAPGHFSEGFLVYKDTSDKDFDNIIVAMEPMEPKPGLALISKPSRYASCEMPATPTVRSIASDGRSTTGGSKPQGADPSVAAPHVDSTKFKAKQNAIKSKSASVPFSDW